MSSPSSSTGPAWRVPSIRSFMRLSTRRNVDLPQPEGPIRATTERSGTGSDTSNSACRVPYQKDRLRTSNLCPTVRRSDGARPFWLRYVMMAEYDSVDKGASWQVSGARRVEDESST